MKKNKFFNIVFMLIIGGFITKVLGMIIKIVMTRILKTEGIGIYMLIMPTFSLLVSISQLGFPTSISKLVAEDKFNNKRLVLGIIPISLAINLFLLIVILLSSNFISNTLLHEKRTIYGIISIGFVLPFISISSILRGYFFGKQKMFPHVLSNILEDVIRLVLIVLFVPSFMKKGVEFAVSFIILTSIASELSTIIIFMFFAPKKINLKKEYFYPKKENINNILSISIPTTGSRLIGNFGYFLEPIILTFVLKSVGYSSKFIILEYGIINGYVMPILLLPSFFTLAISQALIPLISKSYSESKIIYTRKKINQAIFYSLLVGIPFTLLFILKPSIPLKLIYNTNIGINYIKFLAPICILHYIQAPLTGALQAMGKAKEAMMGTLIGMTFRTMSLFLFSFFKIGLWGLIIAISLNIIIVTVHQAKKIKEALSLF